MELAIKGHETRGAEVIALLEMLGGINVGNLYGDVTYAHYFINNNYIDVGYVSEPNSKQYLLYSLEKFEEKYPYKVGDRVIIKVNNQEAIIDKVVWCCDTIIYWLKYDDCLEGNWRTEHLRPYKEETMVKQKKDYEEWCPINYLEFENNDDTWDDEVEVNLGKDYEIQIRGDKTFIVKKKPQYPKTYKECCGVLKIPKNEHYIDIDAPLVPSDYNRLVSAFTKLLICRDAYWRIAGEQMGWGNPWEPDSKNKVYYIFYCVSNNTIKRSEGNLYSNVILAFPTKEMRDAFFENFKDLIEQCKELL